MKKSVLFIILPCIIFCSKTFAQAPVVSSITGVNQLCAPGATSTFSVLATNSPVFYTWSIQPSAGVVISNPSASVTSISFPNTNANIQYFIHCTATNNSGTSGASTKVLMVYETPTVTFSGAMIFCQGSSTNLSASSTIYAASSTLLYDWQPGSGIAGPNHGQSVVANPSVSTNYTLTVSNGPCMFTDTATVFVDLCVGIRSYGSITNNSLLVYPNPNNGAFLLKSSQPETIRIINDLGQLMQTLQVIPDIETKVSDLPPGIYFIVAPNSRKKLVVTGSK